MQSKTCKGYCTALSAVLATVAVTTATAQEHKPLWDATGLTDIPQAFYDAGLTRVPLVRMRELFLPEPPADPADWSSVQPHDWTEPDIAGVQAAAARYADEPIVILDIEGVPRHPAFGNWYVGNPWTYSDVARRYQAVINTWKTANPGQQVCLYGFPRFSIIDELRKGNDYSYVSMLAVMHKNITDLADCLTPAAYWNVDDPDAQLKSWQYKADLCANTLGKPCHFMITPFSKNRDNQQHELMTLRFSFDNLKAIDGVAGIAVWSSIKINTAEYNQHLQNWGAMSGIYNEPDVSWLTELNYALGDPMMLKYKY